MSVISILSPSSALDVRVASGHQHARRPSVMLRFRDRAAPSFLIHVHGDPKKKDTLVWLMNHVREMAKGRWASDF
ncbi:unnamed protein product, partial [Musa hybrid cultivar]